ncbi:LysR family transcriptional regulator [Cupriavidus respiraculi]|uniref:HTH-type transcriptional regulator GltC n=1 Tax=Cupriavidus respiraculi TaxID=195930 RepID=A0ABM8WMQ4_9BURK|nr:LysR family transcriptional regulator [Cupriavidus respiraculi]MBY4947352.1 LysR family transcriptional regulator [Cupriavidus respiraculi]CAG9168683.1 HTH-type transcriptional regulator GltC [Cupriavidus respiraculi]
MRYELTDLRLFQAIAEAQSLSSGAAAVHITASAASYRLKNLEQAMGTALFVRNSRGMDLTPAGETLLRHVRELLLGVERMHGEVGRFSAGLKGHIRLLANSSSLNGFLLPSVGRFLLAHPDVNIDLEERSSQAILNAIAAQEADIGVMAGEFDTAGVRAMPYAVDELILAVPLGHPLAAQDALRFGAALAFDFVCMSRASSNFQFLRENAQRLGKSPNVRLHAHSFEAVLSLVQAGVGVALVPRSVAAAVLATGRICAVRLAEPWARRKLHLIVRADGKLPAFASAFAQFLLEDPEVAATREPGTAAD